MSPSKFMSTVNSQSQRFQNRFRKNGGGPFFHNSNHHPIFVVDPKTFATRLLIKQRKNFNVDAFDDVLESTNTRLVRLFVWLKRISESWFTHVFLLIALILYACLGGAIFSAIEGRHEEEQNAIIRSLYEPIDETADQIVRDLWTFRQNFPPQLPLIDPHSNESTITNDQIIDYIPDIDPDWFYEVQRQLTRFDAKVLEQCTKRLNYSIERFSETNRWDFVGSVFFSMTVFTTIGYGDNPPVTTFGKAATMIYSFFGIPLLLIVLADFGRIFTKTIKYMIMGCRRVYYDRSLRRVRHMNRNMKNTKAAKVQQALLEALQKIQRPPPFYVDPKTGRVTMLPPPEISLPDLQSSTNPMVTPSPSTSRMSNNIPMITLTSPSSNNNTLSPETPMPQMLDFDEMDDEFNLPVSLALFILLFYLFLGAVLFWAFENWTLFQSFYFVFISMSTIGFGDFVPTQYNVLLYAFIYFLFGLALTSMCINVIQEKLSSTFERAKITIGESIGLDPTTPITIVNNDDGNASGTGGESKPSSKRNSPDIERNQQKSKAENSNKRTSLKP